VTSQGESLMTGIPVIEI